MGHSTACRYQLSFWDLVPFFLDVAKNSGILVYWKVNWKFKQSYLYGFGAEHNNNNEEAPKFFW